MPLEGEATEKVEQRIQLYVDLMDAIHNLNEAVKEFDKQDYTYIESYSLHKGNMYKRYDMIRPTLKKLSEETSFYLAKEWVEITETEDDERDGGSVGKNPTDKETD